MIDAMFSIRVRNNVPWQRLMELALKHAPKEAVTALREINLNDRIVSDLLGRILTANSSRDPMSTKIHKDGWPRA